LGSVACQDNTSISLFISKLLFGMFGFTIVQ